MFTSAHSTTLGGLDAAELAWGCVLEEAERCAGAAVHAAGHVLEETEPRSAEVAPLRGVAGQCVAGHALEGGATS